MFCDRAAAWTGVTGEVSAGSVIRVAIINYCSSSVEFLGDSDCLKSFFHFSIESPSSSSASPSSKYPDTLPSESTPLTQNVILSPSLGFKSPNWSGAIRIVSWDSSLSDDALVSLVSSAGIEEIELVDIFLGCKSLFTPHNENVPALCRAGNAAQHQPTDIMQIEITAEFLKQQGWSPTFPERFWKKVDKTSSPNGCWLWTGATQSFGYGELQRGIAPHRPVRVHVASWIMENGPIPEGMCVRHQCSVKHNPSCINPAHLLIGTHQQNMQDMLKAGRHYFSNTPGRKGYESYSCKLTKEQRTEILARYTGKRGQQSQFAREYGVSQALIWNVVNHVGFQE